MGNLLFSGGVLFAIVLEACPVADNKKEYMDGGKATFKSGEILQELAQLSGIKRSMPASTDASEYKKCTAQGAMHIQNKKFIKDFDENIKTKYNELYKRSERFVNTYFFDCRDEHEAVAERLFYALDISKNIPDTASFIYTDGDQITKEELLKKEDINLPALILAIWHYCILNITDNKKGSNLFNYLFSNENSGNIYHFNKTLDNPFQDMLNVDSGNPNVHDEYFLTPLDEVSDDEDEDLDDEIDIVKNDTESIHQENIVETDDVTKIENKGTPAQTINFNFTVNGDNANVRNIVNNGTYIEGDDKDDK